MAYPEGNAAVPRPPGNEHHERRDRWGEPGRVDDEGSANMATTKRYLRLAGVVFAEEAEALERRLLGGLVPESGTDEPQTALGSPTA